LLQEIPMHNNISRLSDTERRAYGKIEDALLWLMIEFVVERYDSDLEKYDDERDGGCVSYRSTPIAFVSC
jgi:hypothetical protein